MRDILDNVTQKRIACLDHGFVEIIDVMPRLAADDAEYATADAAIVQAARVSYGHGTKKLSDDRDLIRYMMRHAHGSPLEAVIFKLVMKMPIFVARQIIRHRISSVSELSARYTEMADEFYAPERFRLQSGSNRQGSDGLVDEAKNERMVADLRDYHAEAFEGYQALIADGVAKEQARIVLPVSLYTCWNWTINLRSLLNFLDLRCDAHSQWECRAYAEAVRELVSPLVPLAMEAWQDYSPYRGAVLLTRLEADALRQRMLDMDSPCTPAIASENQRERVEWAAKAKKLGLS